VVEPTDDKLASLKNGGVAYMEAWPIEQRMPKLKRKTSIRDSFASSSASLGGGTPSTSDESVERRRKITPLSDFEDERLEINLRLRELNMEPLQEIETVCARLYTGPMYCKYNTVLRDIGHLRSQLLATQLSMRSARETPTRTVAHHHPGPAPSLVPHHPWPLTTPGPG
jgi:hypothetical protein